MSFQSFEAAVHFNACGFSANLAFVDIWYKKYIDTFGTSVT